MTSSKRDNQDKTRELSNTGSKDRTDGS